MEAKSEYISPETYEENNKSINFIPNMLSIFSKNNQHTCIGFAKWEGIVKYINLYFDLNDEKYKAVDHKIWVTDCKLDYDAFNKLYEIFKPYLYADHFHLGYFSIIPPTDKKEVNKLNKAIKKALG